jgi:NAD(P)-dependent dehydrogenase (short-subunit alcohol dehydrogenase family)
MRTLKPLAEQTIVITGASSGIGRLTARGRGLEVLAEEIRADGGQALAVAADVTDRAALATVADRAVAGFGGIDTWVNNAGVSVYGAFTDLAPEEFERVIAVDLIGVANGAWAALPHLEHAGQGALIFVGSVLSERAAPMQSAYCAAKHGVKALADALQVELRQAGSEVQVTLVKPASMNTPFFAHARTRMGVMPKPIDPVYDPAVTSRAILHAAEHRTREIATGGATKAFTVLETFGGPILDALLTAVGTRAQRSDQPKQAVDPNNLFEPVPGLNQERGEWGGRPFSLYTWAKLHPRQALAGAAAAGVAFEALRRRRRAA